MTTEERQGVSAWLRGIVDECGVGGTRSCLDIAEAFGIDCKHEKTCRDCMTKMMTAIADRIDAERALPEGMEWPRFEDGGLVNVGSEVELEGETMLVFEVALDADGWALWCENDGLEGRLRESYCKRVKRPVPKVLAADGAPIEVGDTVYLRSNGRKGEVTGFYEEDGATWVAVSYELGGDRMTVNTEGKALTHERPDSWERIEDDAYSLVMSEYLDTPEEDVRDLVRRAKALAKAGEGE